MLCAPPLPLRALLLVTGLALLGGCNTQHSPAFKASEATAQPAKPAPTPAPRALPEGTAEGIPEHLLNEYAGRDVAPDAEIHTWDLPTKSKRVIVELLITAARDEPEHLRKIMTQQARWGAPDRREYDARPVLDDGDGHVFLDTLRAAASRFARKQNLSCPPIMPPAAQTYVRTGAEPMWCFYGSNDGLDILAFKLMIEGGSAKIDYVGMYAERPTSMTPRPGPQPPPMTPVVRRTAGAMPRLPPGMTGTIEPGQPGQLGVINPGQPGVIINPGQPGQPGGVITPGQPGAAAQPGQPGQPGAATQPGQPAAAQPGQPAAAQPGTATQPGQPASTPGKPAGAPPASGTPAAKKPAAPKQSKPAPATAPAPAAAPAAPAQATPPAP